MSKKKKHVKAPLTYDPGKGRPKEHLAYLNYQEMQALKRLNGENVERGPRGLPSFASTGPSSSLSAPARTAPSTSTTSPTRTTSYGISTPTTRTTTTTTTTRSSGPSTSLSSPVRTASSTGTISRSSTSTTSKIGSAASAQRTGSAYQAPSPSGGRSGFSGAGTNTRDAVARQVAASRDATKIARESPAFRGDAVKGGVRSINVGPMGKEVQIGGKVKGAISQVAEAAKKPTAVNNPSTGPFAPTPDKYKTPAAMQQAMVRDIVENKLRTRYGKNYDQKQADMMVATIMGESAGENGFGRAAVANSMLNRMAGDMVDNKKFGYMGGGNFYSLMAEYDANGLSERVRQRGPNEVYTQSIPGSKLYGQGLVALNQAIGQDSQFNRTASPTVKNATHFYNPRDASPDWENIKNFERVGNHMFGNAEKIGNQIAAAQRIALAREKLTKDQAEGARKAAAATIPDSGVRKTAGPAVSPRTAAAAVIGIPPQDTYRDPFVAAGQRPQAYTPPIQTMVAGDPRVGIPPALNRPNIATNAAALADKAASLASGLFGNQTPAAAPIGPDPFMVAKKPAEMGVVAPRGNPSGPFGAPVPDSKLPGKVALEPMKTPDMPGAPKGTTTKTDVYTVKKGSIPADAEKTISDVLKNPDKITQLAKEQKWGNQDPKRLAEIKRDINTLKELGVKVENGKITIPKAAAQKAQTTLNKIATSYSPTFGKMATGYGETFNKGLGTISTKGSVTETKPPSADQLARYDMNMADYRDAMRGLAMSPSLQKPGDVYAGAVPTEKKIAMSDAGVRKSMPGAGIIGTPGGAVGPDPFMVAGTPAARGIAAIPTGSPAGPFGAPVPNSNLPAPIGRDPFERAFPRAEAAIRSPKPTPNPLNDTSKFIQQRKDVFNNVRPEILSAAVRLQEQIGEPLIVTSGYRDKKHNADVGGAKGSQHIQRNALDIKLQNSTPEKVANLIRAASSQGFTGIGAYASGKVHVDMGNRRTWSNGNDDSQVGKLPRQVQAALKEHEAGLIARNSVTTQTDPANPQYKKDQLPRYVSPEDWQKVVDQNTKNKIGLGVMKRAPGAGSVLSIIDTGKKLITGKSIAEGSMDMKRAYLQASPAEQLAMRQKYPDMDRFARSLGALPLGGNIASSNGGVSPNFPDLGRGGSSGNSGGIYGVGDLVRAASGGGGAGGSSGDSGGSASAVSSRPYEHYEWDLGINIPSPGDAKYNEFQGYLAERAAAQAALYT